MKWIKFKLTFKKIKMLSSKLVYSSTVPVQFAECQYKVKMIVMSARHIGHPRPSSWKRLAQSTRKLWWPHGTKLHKDNVLLQEYVSRGVDIPFTNYRQRLDLNFKAAVQTVNAHLNQNHIFLEFSFPAFSCLVFSCLAFSLPVFSCLVFSWHALWCRIFMSCIFTTCIFDGAEISFLAFSVAPYIILQRIYGRY